MGLNAKYCYLFKAKAKHFELLEVADWPRSVVEAVPDIVEEVAGLVAEVQL